MTNKVRTTVYLPEDLVDAVRLEALSRGTSMTQMVEQGLKNQIKSDKRKKKKYIFKSYNMGNKNYKFKRSDAYE